MNTARKMKPSRRFIVLQNTIQDEIQQGMRGDNKALTHIFRSYNSVTYFMQVFAKISRYVPHKLKKEEYRWMIRNTIGTTPTIAFKYFQKQVLRQITIPIEKYIKDFGFSFNFKKRKPQLHIRNCCAIMQKIQYIKQLDNDNLYHLIPLVLNTGGISLPKNPKDICKTLKSLHTPKTWGMLCSNSKTRNKLLGKYLPSGRENLVYMPSSQLTKTLSHPRATKEAILKVLSILKESKLKHEAFTHTMNLLLDGLQMANLTKLPSNIKTHTQLKDFHDKWVDRHNKDNLLKYDTSPLCKKVQFKYKGLSVEGLTTEREIAAHGLEMHHCVVMYAASVAEKTYYILTIRSEKDEVCTLGLRIEGTGFTTKWALSQCYGKCNESPFISEEQQKDIIKIVNKNELINLSCV